MRASGDNDDWLGRRTDRSVTVATIDQIQLAEIAIGPIEKCRCNQSLENFELGRSDIFYSVRFLAVNLLVFTILFNTPKKACLN